MPEQKTLDRARRDKQRGKAPSTQAGEFVREEIDHIREGRHGARSAKQAIAIGLSKARRAGVELKPPAKGTAAEKARESAARAYARGHGAPPASRARPRRSRATIQALGRESRSAASSTALAKQARTAAKQRTGAQRSAAGRAASRTKSPAQRSAAARKAAHTRAAHAHA